MVAESGRLVCLVDRVLDATRLWWVPFCVVLFGQHFHSNLSAQSLAQHLSRMKGRLILPASIRLPASGGYGETHWCPTSTTAITSWKDWLQKLLDVLELGPRWTSSFCYLLGRDAFAARRRNPITHQQA